jgi:putative FmdB family regulatory protein
MPIYEYRGCACNADFELLRLSSGDEPEWPKCLGHELEKKLSRFAAGRREAALDPATCGTCGDPRGSGACAAFGGGSD